MTRLYFVAGRILLMGQEIFERPREMLEEITAVGLLHVGMNIPREFFLPFAGSVAAAFDEVLKNEVAGVAFRWPLGAVWA